MRCVPSDCIVRAFASGASSFAGGVWRRRP